MEPVVTIGPVPAHSVDKCPRTGKHRGVREDQSLNRALPRFGRDAAMWPGNLRELVVETRMNSASIFDLSPSEKLQLVEDLWDDLAAAPEAVPVHDWQKQELARRKANLLKNPASGLPWEEVKRKVRARYAR